MQTKLCLEIRGRAGVITFNAPPLNLIDREVRTELLGCIEAAKEHDIDRLILTSACSVFVAGADAGEFGRPPEAPHLNDVLWVLATLPIPTISVLEGAALGGGCEIALACRARIASPAARLGLPEVQLGLVPGAGGTQRLPRLVGIPLALKVIVSGKTLSATDALDAGAVTALSDTPLDYALSMTLSELDELLRPNDLPAPVQTDDEIDSARATATRRMPGQTAPHQAIDLIEAAATEPLDTALVNERKAFLTLRKSEQARALRHVFFAERAAQSRSRSYPDDGREVNTACVVGGGNMGASIAYALATAGVSVKVVERDEANRVQAKANCEALISAAQSRGLITPENAATIGARMAYVTGYDQLSPANLAIEAAYEDMEVKKDILSRLEAVLPETCILATNTSYLNVNEMGAELSHPDRFLGLHFFSPAHIMKLLEVIRADKTSEDTLGAAFRLARTLRKIPVLSGVCEGFIGNRILKRYREAAHTLLLQGATPVQIDQAMREFGMAMGPFEAQDMSGLDIAYANSNRARQHQTFRTVADRLIEDHKRLGRKAGGGWYDYSEGKASVSELVENLIETVARETGAERQRVSDTDITNVLVGAMADEARSILDEGIAKTPDDIDLVMIHGYGFPRCRGGVMLYAASGKV
ncbi:3-hydroxyacyl-CoA dehydrogenase [Roseovarius sp. MBR-51]